MFANIKKSNKKIIIILGILLSLIAVVIYFLFYNSSLSGSFSFNAATKINNELDGSKGVSINSNITSGYLETAKYDTETSTFSDNYERTSDGFIQTFRYVWDYQTSDTTSRAYFDNYIKKIQNDNPNSKIKIDSSPTIIIKGSDSKYYKLDCKILTVSSVSETVYTGGCVIPTNAGGKILALQVIDRSLDAVKSQIKNLAQGTTINIIKK